MKGFAGYTGLLKLAVLLVGLPLLAYSWGVRASINLYRTVNEQADRIRLEEFDSTRITPIIVLDEKKEDHTGDAIKTGAVLYRLTLLLEQHNVTAEQYTPYLTYTGAEAELYTGELLLSGKFISLTQALQDMRQNFQDGRIVSVSYRTVNHPQTRKKQLQMTVIFQQITLNE